MGRLEPLNTIPELERPEFETSAVWPTKRHQLEPSAVWPTEPPTLPSVTGKPRPGPCPTPFGMAAPRAARSGVFPVDSGRRVGHGPGRWIALFAPLIVGAMLLAFAVGAAVWRTHAKPATQAPSVVTAIPPVAAVVPPVSSQDPRAKLDHIRRGDPDAMSALESRPKHLRTIEENLALAEGRSVHKKGALRALRDELLTPQSPERRRIALNKLAPFLEDGETAKASVGILAQVPGPEGPDALYELWTKTSERSELTLLARDLVFSADVRPRASDSLAATLDLRRAETCGQIRDALPHVWAHGDRRALTTLVRIAQKYPCPTGRAEECHPCLHGAVSLHDAIETVKTRPAPVLFW